MITCPQCKGEGEFLVPRPCPSGYIESREECSLCYGEKLMPEDEVIMLKLEGYSFEQDYK